MREVSIFKNFNEIIEDKSIPLILDEIKSGKYRPAIIYLRKSLAENKLEAYEKAKKSLPAFTPSGKFNGGRKPDFLVEYSQFIILDIDKLEPDNLQKAISVANQSEFTYASFISPSGNGFKILVKVTTDKESHLKSFLDIQAYYENQLSLTIDKSGKDITRLCFYSYDENLYFNPNAKVFQATQEDIIEPIIELITTAKNSKLETSDSQLLYQHTVKFTEKKVQFINGSRNVFVHQLACNLNRKAMPQNIALDYILSDYNYDEIEVRAAVNSAYSNNSEFGKSTQKKEPKKVENEVLSFGEDLGEEDDKPKPTIIDKLEMFLLNKYIFRHNIVSGKLEFQYKGKKKWNLMNDFIENSMLRECLKARIKTNLSSLRNLLHSDFCPLYNPFEDYFDSLPPFDSKQDYITELANTITTTHQDFWQECFKKWLVAMVGCVLNDKIINHTVIVFSGKQGLGKTTWVENLIPKQLKEYLFSGTINPNNKDTLIQLSECMLINLDELENLNRSEIGSLKEIITKTQIRMRKAYGHNNETMPRRASFAGSVNTAQFLNDSTGSRRFLCFEVENIQYQYDINLDQVYAQALQLLNSDFRYWFDQSEIKNITDNNEQYQLRSPEEELLLTWFEPVVLNDKNEYCTFDNDSKTLLPLGGVGGGLTFLNASQIGAKLADRAKFNLTDGTINKLGKALKKHNFIRVKRKTNYVYAVRELTYDDVDSNNRIKEDNPFI
jgi:hypothetical protein